MSATRTALARTYRPRKFAEMATQEHISGTLKSGSEWPRRARVPVHRTARRGQDDRSARPRNGAQLPNRRRHGEPCGVCESCEKDLVRSTSLDVIKMNAASNRGVNDARDLRERAMYTPQTSIATRSTWSTKLTC